MGWRLTRSCRHAVEQLCHARLRHDRHGGKIADAEPVGAGETEQYAIFRDRELPDLEFGVKPAGNDVARPRQEVGEIAFREAAGFLDTRGSLGSLLGTVGGFLTATLRHGGSRDLPASNAGDEIFFFI